MTLFLDRSDRSPPKSGKKPAHMKITYDNTEKKHKNKNNASLQFAKEKT